MTQKSIFMWGDGGGLRGEGAASDTSSKHINYCHIYRQAPPPSPPVPPPSNSVVGRVLLSYCLFPYFLCYGGIKRRWWLKGGGHSGADLPTAVSVVGTRAPSPCCVTLQPPQAFSGVGGGRGQHLSEAEAIEMLKPASKTGSKRHMWTVLARYNRSPSSVGGNRFKSQ